jgi:hypothetical protein
LATAKDFDVDQGASFSRTVTVRDAVTGLPVDLTGYVGRGTLKASLQDAVPAMSFTVTFAADRTTGQVTFSYTSVQSSALPVPGTTYSKRTAFQYDWELESPSGWVDRLYNGAFNFSPEGTK